MIVFLRFLFAAILLAMLAVTIEASLQQGVFEAGRALWPDPWFRATLADAYFGFIAVYVWIAYRESTWAARIIWFVLLMGLGNIAIAVYMLIRLFGVSRDASIESVLRRPRAAR